MNNFKWRNENGQMHRGESILERRRTGGKKIIVHTSCSPRVISTRRRLCGEGQERIGQGQKTLGHRIHWA